MRFNAATTMITYSSDPVEVNPNSPFNGLPQSIKRKATWVPSMNLTVIMAIDSPEGPWFRYSLRRTPESFDHEYPNKRFWRVRPEDKIADHALANRNRCWRYR